jgi:hypothetical protein
MVGRARWRTIWLLGTVAAAAAACGSSSTSPAHQPPCPTYSGGLAQGDSLYGLFHLVSYCLDTLPAHGPPNDTGHVTLSRAMSGDSFAAVLATQGQPPESIVGRYTHPLPDSIHVTGVVKVSGLAVPVEVLGRFVLQNNTLSVSGTLAGRPLSFSGTRTP